MTEYTKDQQQAVCDALTAIVHKADEQSELGNALCICGPGIVWRALRFNIAWDNDAKEFRTR